MWCVCTSRRGAAAKERTRLAGNRAPALERRKPWTSRAKAGPEPGSGSGGGGGGGGGGVQICTRDFTYSSIRLLELLGQLPTFCLPVPPHTLGLFSTFLFPATFRVRKQSFQRSPWVNFCNKLGTFGQTLQSQRSASKDVVDEGARRIDLTRRGGTSPTLPPPLPLYHLVHHPSITITQTHYRHQSWSCAAL